MIIRLRRRKKIFVSELTESLIIDFFEYILCFFVAICTTGMWWHFGNGIAYVDYLKFLIPCFCITISGIKMFLYKTSKVPLDLFLLVAFFGVCIFINVLSQYPAFSTIIYLFVTLVGFLLMAFLLSNQEIESVWRKYVNVIFIISVISLFFYIFGSLLYLVGSNETITYEWDWTRRAFNYYNIYYAPTSQISDTLIYGLQKNCGIYTEATMFAYMLNIAYMTEMRSHVSRMYVKIVLAVTIFTTLSTMGIVSFVIYNGLILIASEPKSRFLKICKILFLPLVVVMGIAGLSILSIYKMATGSYGVRYDHIVTCFKAFFDTFPVGLGYGGSLALRSLFHYKQGISVGIPGLFAYGGLGGALLILVPSVIYCYYSLKMQEWENVAFEIAFTCSFFFTSVVLSSTLQWMIISLIYARESYEMRRGWSKMKSAIEGI